MNLKYFVIAANLTVCCKLNIKQYILQYKNNEHNIDYWNKIIFGIRRANSRLMDLDYNRKKVPPFYTALSYQLLLVVLLAIISSFSSAAAGSSSSSSSTTTRLRTSQYTFIKEQQRASPRCSLWAKDYKKQHKLEIISTTTRRTSTIKKVCMIFELKKSQNQVTNFRGA